MFVITQQIVQQTADYLKQHLAINNPYYTVSYKKIVEDLQLPELDGNWSNHPLCKIFDQLDQLDAKLSRPLRTSIVINKSTGKPGPGFFKALGEYTKKSIPKDDIKQLELWADQLEQAKKYNY
ncbi:hypothetical protein F975_01660 [Acinetobacter sp. ANC 3789]|uniref:hypothetical protein n=1 Tax=Acinetobacter sp. ANC 3789 TaxID=1217714 RepID=UPI0002CD9C38|nr:hypothetical protein [Acinetobacter sp. ANC 3789]ENU80606.1 hypothetical protein F975_01660 [Acinetobacter sp. ANC 3789]